jgi:benzoylformate decarboxylase
MPASLDQLAAALKQPLSGSARVRTVSDRVAPDAERLRSFADRISASRRPALVFGPEVDRGGGWDAAVALAERLRAAVYRAPLLDRASFPEDHPLFGGPLGMSVKTISDRLAGHDLVVVIGAEVFRYYPYVPGDYLPAGTELLQITADPGITSVARGSLAAVDVETTEDLEREFKAALSADTTTVIVVPTRPRR